MSESDNGNGYSSPGAVALREFLKSKGFDGIKYLDYFEGSNDDYSYIAFEPNQIKSATDNIGLFDGNDPDIRFSLSPSAELVDSLSSSAELLANLDDGLLNNQAEINAMGLYREQYAKYAEIVQKYNEQLQLSRDKSLSEAKQLNSTKATASP